MKDSNGNGKGSETRPFNREKYESEYERIFKEKPIPPPPRAIKDGHMPPPIRRDVSKTESEKGRNND